MDTITIEEFVSNSNKYFCSINYIDAILAYTNSKEIDNHAAEYYYNAKHYEYIVNIDNGIYYRNKNDCELYNRKEVKLSQKILPNFGL